LDRLSNREESSGKALMKTGFPQAGGTRNRRVFFRAKNAEQVFANIQLTTLARRISVFSWSIC
jgi:hypothetical protein